MLEAGINMEMFSSICEIAWSGWWVQLEKEREQLKMEVSKGVVKIKNTDMAVAQHLTNIVNLNRIIGEADAEKMQLKKDLETTKSERDVLGIQVKLLLLFTLWSLQHSFADANFGVWQMELSQLIGCDNTIKCAGCTKEPRGKVIIWENEDSSLHACEGASTVQRQIKWSAYIEGQDSWY